MAMIDSIADRIRTARTKASLTQTQLADELQVNRSAVAQWERREGGTHPHLRHLTQIAVITGVGFEWLAIGRKAASKSAGESSAIAQNAFERRCLKALRRIAPTRQLLVVELLNELTENVRTK